MNYESKYERGLISLLLVDPQVRDIQEQPPEVAYVDTDGRRRVHIFDFLVRRAGRRIAIDVKPSDKVAGSRIETVQRLIREQTGTSFADEFIVRTEQHIHPDDVHDAETILRARRLPDPAADAAVKRLTAGLIGEARIGALVELTGLESAAFNAIARLIGERVLETCEGARITHDAMVRRCG